MFDTILDVTQGAVSEGVAVANHIGDPVTARRHYADRAASVVEMIARALGPQSAVGG